jgi:hypothetical protein
MYTTTAILAASMPDPERASEGNDRRATILRLHRAIRWVHMAGMILMPILGILSIHPEVFGLSTSPGGTPPNLTPSPAANFGTAMRTAHVFIGYTTFTALTFAMVLELI